MNSMDEVIPNLWLGDLPSALSANLLVENKIKYILSAMRGTVNINPVMRSHQVPVDDLEEFDILQYIPECIVFIEKALKSDEAVLVHCQAGISRSATVVAAYLMSSRKLDVDSAMKIIMQARPGVQPNPGFLKQLQIYYSAKYTISQENKDVRAFYLQRSADSVMNGGGEMRVDMFASTSTTSSDQPHRRIRCKMCRRELATRDLMMDHGYLSPPTPPLSPVTGHKDLPVTPGDAENPSPSNASDEKSQSALPSDNDKLLSLEPLSIQPLSLDNSTPAKSSPSTQVTSSATPLLTPQEIAARLPNSLAALRGTRPPQSMPSSSTPSLSSISAALRGPSASKLPVSRVGSNHGALGSGKDGVPPIILNPKCSGYFVEPLKWMDPLLRDGAMAGKIICPNDKCKAKLGNFDWAGVACGCRNWVVPGFCISRSKVDEIR